MKIIQKKIEDIIPYEKNPRRNDAAVDAVAASIKEFGFKVPIVIDKDNVIVAGHTRLKAAKKLGLEEAPVIVADDLTEDQVKAFRLADNKTAELAGWDFDLLESELLSINAIDMGEFGFEVEQPEDPDDVIEDNYNEEEEQIEERVKPGDVWVLGSHKLICGDSTKTQTLDRLLGKEKPVFVFTDPPYGVSVGDKNKKINKLNGSHSIEKNIENDTLRPEELKDFLTPAFEQLRLHCTDYCSYYISSPQGGELLTTCEAMTEAGLAPRHMLIWVKNQAPLSLGLDYSYKHEPILYTWTKKHNFFGGYHVSVIDDTKPLEKMNKAELKELVHALQEKTESDVVYVDKPLVNDLHPTMKPIKLIARFMINSSKKEDKVLDIFGGSGSTMIAAEQLERRCYMVEFDPHYCDVILDRWEKFTGKKAVLENV